MEVPAGQDGIQRLLASEKEAQSVVAKARKGTARACALFTIDFIFMLGARAWTALDVSPIAPRPS